MSPLLRRTRSIRHDKILVDVLVRILYHHHTHPFLYLGDSMYSIEQLAKKHLYTEPGNPFWEAAGYEAFAQEIIDICCSKVEHIYSHGQSIGEIIRKQFDK